MNPSIHLAENRRAFERPFAFADKNRDEGYLGRGYMVRSLRALCQTVSASYSPARAPGPAMLAQKPQANPQLQAMQRRVPVFSR